MVEQKNIKKKNQKIQDVLNKHLFSLFAKKLYKYLNNFEYFTDEDIDNQTEYILYDDWWDNLKYLVE